MQTAHLSAIACRIIKNNVPCYEKNLISQSCRPRFTATLTVKITIFREFLIQDYEKDIWIRQRFKLGSKKNPSNQAFLI